MQFVSIFTPAQQSSGPPSAEHIARMGALIGRKTKDGSLLFTGPIGKSERGVRIRAANGAVDITNGPFSESTFARGSGFALFKVASQEEMIAFVKEFLAIAGEGTCEVMPLLDGPPPQA